MKKRLVIVAISLIVISVLLIDYGWRLFGFNACSNPSVPSIDEIIVTDEHVTLTGTTYSSSSHYVGSFTAVQDNTLYIGMRYQLITVFNGGGSFDLEIPVDDEEIDRIYIKGNGKEELIWEKD